MLRKMTLIMIVCYIITVVGLCSCTYVEHNRIRSNEAPYNPIKIKLVKYIKDPHIAEVISKSRYPLILAAIAKVESDYRPLIRGDGGDSRGLYQLQERHWGKFGDTLEEQTKKAEIVLGSLIREYGPDKAIERYNGSGKQARIYKAKVFKVMREIENC